MPNVVSRPIHKAIFSNPFSNKSMLKNIAIEQTFKKRPDNILFLMKSENLFDGTLLKNFSTNFESCRVLITAGNKTPKKPIISVANVNIPESASDR